MRWKDISTTVVILTGAVLDVLTVTSHRAVHGLVYAVVLICPHSIYTHGSIYCTGGHH